MGTDKGVGVGLFSDLPDDDRYDDSTLAGGDCVTIITPAEDGVDQGKLVFFAPGGEGDCGPQRQIKVLGSYQDLDGDGNYGEPPPDGVDVAELVDVRFGCDDVFPKDPPPDATTDTSCNLEVRQYGDGDFERTWIIEWPWVRVTHSSGDPDFKRLLAINDAEIFRLDPPTKGKGKKDKVYVGSVYLPFLFEVTRVRTP